MVKKLTNPILRGLNMTAEGVCMCLKTTMYKVSVANFVHTDGRAATGVMEVYETE